jgi:hydroxyethylthiazole kinase-like uncharacterized protein yjeF
MKRSPAPATHRVRAESKRMPASRAVTAALLRSWPLPSGSDGDGKEDRGRVLVVGGCRQVPGAVLLAGTAALRAGAGMLQLATVADAALALAVAMPEALVMPLRSNARGEVQGASDALYEKAANADALVIGSGMPPTPASLRLATALLDVATGTVLLDAGALQAHARAGRRAQSRPTAILTPHAGEMARLTGEDEGRIREHAATIARDFAATSNVIVVLKGPATQIAHPDGRLWIHRGGGPGLGTSGSGDALAGVIGGLAARGASPEQAAVWGVALHALAGARLARRIGTLGFLAREIAGEIPPLMDAFARDRRRTRRAQA